MNHNKIIGLSIFVTLLTGTGCTQYVISTPLREQAALSPAFTTVRANPGKYIGYTVIWGGVIIETVNQPNHTTITILQTPLELYQVPKDPEQSQGRFIARVDGYLDREVYHKGRKVTVAGQISGQETLPIGEMQYTYPVVKVQEIYLWRSVAPYYRPYYRQYYWGWGSYPAWPYPGGWWGPFWGP
jgi:outer membrane lipoprotein